MFKTIRIIYLLSFSLILLFATLFLQAEFDIIEIKPLQGAITKNDNVDFTLTDWFSGKYQEKKEKYLNETFGFRNIMVRLNNQIFFNLFDKAKANGVIIGKKKYLFEENYIKAYYGNDFIGEDRIKERMQRIKFLQDKLSKLNKTILLVFAAGKGSYYPEYFPESYHTSIGKTNYDYHKKYAEDLEINHIDFNKYFSDNKKSSTYPLYPQYGIHWSFYGSCLAADSIVKYIGNIRHINMPDVYWDAIEWGDPRGSDADIEDGMNLLFRLKSFKMAYPNVQIRQNEIQQKPSILVVSDSYFWNMFNFGISNAFSDCHFWFYNNLIYPDSYKNPLSVNQVNIKEELLKHDVIMIMATTATLPDLGWGFIEAAELTIKNEEIFQNLDSKKKIDEISSAIKNNPEWLRDVKIRAVERKVSVDSMIILEAIWVFEHN